MIVNSALWSISGSLFSKVLTLSTYILVSRQVDPSIFGLLVFATLLLDFFAVVGTGGARENYIRSETVNDRLAQGTFIYCLSIGCLMSFLFLIIFITADTLNYFQGPSLAYFLLSPIPLIVSTCGFYQGVLERENKFKQLALRNIFISFSSGIVGVALALFEYGIFALVASRLMGPVINLIVIRRLVSFIPRPDFDIDVLREVWNFGGRLTISQFFNFSSGRVFELTSMLVFGPISMALTDIARKIYITLNAVLITPLNPVSLSYLSKSSEPRKLYFRFLLFVCSVVFPAFALISAFSDIIIQFIFGSKWESSIELMTILGWAIVPQLITWYLHNLCIRFNRPDSVLWLHVINFSMVFTGMAAAVIIDVSLVDSMWMLVAALFLSSILRLVYVALIVHLSIFRLLVLYFISAAYFALVHFLSRMLFESFALEWPAINDPSQQFYWAFMYCSLIMLALSPITVSAYRRLKSIS